MSKDKRGGVFIPGATGEGAFSETKAWEFVLEKLNHMHKIVVLPKTEREKTIKALVFECQAVAVPMMLAAREGIHKNPLVTYALGNPGAGSPLGKKGELGRSDWSDRVEEIRYKHKDGKYYRHPFEPGVSLRANPDGSVTLYRRDGRPLWEDFE